MLTSVLGVLFDGFAYGMLLFLLSVGLSVTLGMMNFVNLAHCTFGMIGGYVTVTPDHRLAVSRRLRDEFENGKVYYAMEGTPLTLPASPQLRPAAALMVWHNENLFLGS